MRLAFRLEEVLQDIRYGVRGLVKRPGFTLMTVSSLALGIAATTVVLSLIDSHLLRPLPVPHAAELVVVGASNRDTGSMTSSILGLPTVRDLAARTDLFQDAAGVSLMAAAFRLAGAERAERGMFLTATGSYFSVLGLPAARGRVYSPEDDRHRARVLVLTHQAWQGRFGADPAIVGRTVHLNTVPFEVIGVTPPGFKGTEHLFDAVGFLPAGALGSVEPSVQALEERRDEGRFSLIARRQPDKTVPEIRTALGLMAAQLEAGYPELGEDYRLTAYAESRARPALSVAGGTVLTAVVFALLALLVLVTAAVNAANLILARASTRQTELAVRQALGASRGRLVSQLLTETLLLAFLALAVAWGLAGLAIRALTSIPLSFGGLSLSWGLALDPRVFVMAVAVTLLTGRVAGVGPSVAASRFALQQRLRAGGRSGPGRRGRRVRGALSMVAAAVSPSFFEVLGVPVLEGRGFAATDDSTRAGSAVLNRHAAQLLWPGQPALGRMIRLSREGPALEVVGIVKDGRYFVIGEAPRPFVYLPMAQRYEPWVYLTIRTAGPPDGVIAQARSAIASVDRDLVRSDRRRSGARPRIGGTGLDLAAGPPGRRDRSGRRDQEHLAAP